MKLNTRYYIGYSKDSTLRYKSTSGGIGSSIQKYLLSTRQYGTSITFVFDSLRCQYEPKIIYSEKDINVCGSIYQDINIFTFIKSHLAEIRDGIVISCPPCQVRPISHLLKRSNIPCFIISFCCSGQTTIEGTWCYYRFLGINKNDIVNMQYRGNGWPSGIQIELKNGDSFFYPNYTDPWKLIHETAFFQPKRCFYCTFDTSYEADVSIADPWLKEYKENDRIGCTMFLTNTDLGNEILYQMKENDWVEFSDTDRSSYEIAQKPNVEKKNRVLNQRKYIDVIVTLVENPVTKSLLSKSMTGMKFFHKVRKFLFYMYVPTKRSTILNKIKNKIGCKLRYLRYKSKIGSHKGIFKIWGG